MKCSIGKDGSSVKFSEVDSEDIFMMISAFEGEGRRMDAKCQELKSRKYGAFDEINFREDFEQSKYFASMAEKCRQMAGKLKNAYKPQV